MGPRRFFSEPSRYVRYDLAGGEKKWRKEVLQDIWEIFLHLTIHRVIYIWITVESRIQYHDVAISDVTFILPFLLLEALPLIEFLRKSEYFRRCIEKRRVASGGFSYPLFTSRALCPDETFITEISSLRFSQRSSKSFSTNLCCHSLRNCAKNSRVSLCEN